jgi:hypothetical protein
MRPRSTAPECRTPSTACQKFADAIPDEGFSVAALQGCESSIIFFGCGLITVSDHTSFLKRLSRVFMSDVVRGVTVAVANQIYFLRRLT